jgi:hypothetical protein
MSDKTVKLPCFGIVVELTDIELHSLTPNRYGGGSITSDLKENYPIVEYALPEEKKEAEIEIDLYNSAMDALECLILNHAVAGIDIESPAYIEGIESAVEGCANNI